MSIRDTTGAPNSIVPADYGFEIYGADGRWVGWACDAMRAAAVLDGLTGAQAKAECEVGYCAKPVRFGSLCTLHDAQARAEAPTHAKASEVRDGTNS